MLCCDQMTEGAAREEKATIILSGGDPNIRKEFLNEFGRETVEQTGCLTLNRDWNL